MGTQQLLALLSAVDEIADQVADGVDDGKKKGSKRKLISLDDLEDDSDIEITSETQKSKPRRQTSFGTASQKPMFQSTLDGGSGSFARACSQKKYVPMKSMFRGGRRKPTTQGLSSQAT
ncbi:hypothetical protein Bca52824_035306 [Brassica carinata]|uniref:Uncharacterized protein n=1 Tax=Brassica carinata TaxID=52824 RepID=A0A8X7S1Q4_BRACI|nr:hypothetical protein Bca52824_035306 [Brassica carinata]